MSLKFEAVDVYEKKGWKYKCQCCSDRAKWLIHTNGGCLVYCHKCAGKLKTLLLQITRWP